MYKFASVWKQVTQFLLVKGSTIFRSLSFTRCFTLSCLVTAVGTNPYYRVRCGACNRTTWLAEGIPMYAQLIGDPQGWNKWLAELDVVHNAMPIRYWVCYVNAALTECCLQTSSAVAVLFCLAQARMRTGARHLARCWAPIRWLTAVQYPQSGSSNSSMRPSFEPLSS